MIKVKRIDSPPYLDKPSVKKETQRALELFSQSLEAVDERTLQERKKFKFSKYRNISVKTQLERMFYNKCAYCESSFKHVYYGDIEHFRPKKLVTDNKRGLMQEPGYYWLANEWSNLLLSCLFCNQAKKQYVQPIVNGPLEEITMGKQNEFPLASPTLFGSKRNHLEWVDKGESADESKRELIDPCRDSPEEHFEYTKEGVIVPKVTNGKVSNRAIVSIRVYGLQRHYLVQERLKLYKLLDARMVSCHNSYADWLENRTRRSHIATFYRRRFRLELNELLRFGHCSMPFSGMSRFFLSKFLMDSLDFPPEKLTSLRKFFNQVEDKMDFHKFSSFPGKI